VDKRSLIVIVCLPVFLLSASFAVYGKPWYEGQIRGIYGPQNMSRLAEEGFNVVYKNYAYTANYVSYFREMALGARKNGVTLIAGLYYFSSAPDFNYTHGVTWSGYRERYGPSPSDTTYWEKVIHEPAVALANLSLHYPIGGLVYDFEQYLPRMIYLHEEDDIKAYSYDPASVLAFAGGPSPSVPRLDGNHTFSWLKDKGFLESYQAWQRRKVYEMARRTADEVHSINPNFSLGMMAFGFRSWFHWTILAAWNTGTVPTTVWDESSYGGLKSGSASEKLNMIKQRGLNARYLPGLYTTVQSPRNIVRNMSLALKYCNGFWVYQYDHGHYDLGTEEEYHRAYRSLMVVRRTSRALGGAIIAVLLLAGIALGTVAIRNMGPSMRRSGKPAPECPGKPSLDPCRSCRYMQTFGDGYLCTRFGTKFVEKTPSSEAAPGSAKEV